MVAGQGMDGCRAPTGSGCHKGERDKVLPRMAFLTVDAFAFNDEVHQ